MSLRYRVPAESSAQKAQALSMVGYYFQFSQAKDSEKKHAKRPKLEAPDAAFLLFSLRVGW
jgi:hypothetical protein